MIIYMIRHGETEYNKIGKIQGNQHVPLNDNGLKQAQKISKQIEKISPTHIYCSTLMRAKQTAEIATKNMNIRINYNSDLNERNYGEWQNKLWDDIHKENPKLQETWEKKGIDFMPPNGETVDAMISRTNRFLQLIQTNHNDSDTIAVFTHGGIMKMFIGIALNLPKSEYYNQKLFKNASIITFTYEDGKLKN